MDSLAFGLIALVAAAHLLFMYKEMCRWETFSTGMAHLSPGCASETKALGINQGLYNGFLALGLIWSLCAPAAYDWKLAVFFLGCVFVAGVVGDITIKPPKHAILIAQAGLATLAMLALWASRGVIWPLLKIF